VLVLFLLAPLAGAQGKTYTVPFHAVNGMILLDAKVNGKAATFLLDTGANNTIVSAQAAGLSMAQLSVLKATRAGTGAEGDYISREVSLTLEHRAWLNRRMLIMNLDDASKRMGPRIDGFLGQDVLREFSAVRIDYRTQTITLEN
jgi:Aspartyl protease